MKCPKCGSSHICVRDSFKKFKYMCLSCDHDFNLRETGVSQQ